MAVFRVRLLPRLQGCDLGVPKDAVEVEEQSSHRHAEARVTHSDHAGDCCVGLEATYTPPTSETERFEPGRAIVHRDLQHGRIWYARAEIVVEDREERLLTYWPPGAEVRVPAASDGGAQVRLPTSPWILRPNRWHSFGVLCHWRPGDHHSVWLFWDPAWRFDRWYVNLQAPFVRTPLGFDATDDVLDIEIRPNREWRWKDDHELEAAVKAALLTAEEAAAIRSEGGRAIERMKQMSEPFTTAWTAWRPDERWSVPELPKGWDAVRATF